MRRGLVDIARLQDAVQTAGAVPWTPQEWRRQLLDCGFLVDLAGDVAEPITGIQRGFGDLVRAEEALVRAREPVPWSVGGVPVAAWVIVFGTLILLTGIWNSLVGICGGAVLLGAIALVGLGHHRRLLDQRAAVIQRAERELASARESLRARVLALHPGQFPIQTAHVRVEAGGIPKV